MIEPIYKESLTKDAEKSFSNLETDLLDAVVDELCDTLQENGSVAIRPLTFQRKLAAIENKYLQQSETALNTSFEAAFTLNATDEYLQTNLN